VTQTLDPFVAFTRDPAAHTTGGPASEADLRALELALGTLLPPSYREFLSRFGGGVFFGRHEIFGARHVNVHDIELVPDVVGATKELLGEDPREGGAVLAVHRDGDRIHVLEIRGGTVRSITDGKHYPDFAALVAEIAPR
jgi:hypothetical protein